MDHTHPHTPGVMVTIVGNGIGDLSANPGQGYFCFTSC